jgi:hypothetical protein
MSRIKKQILNKLKEYASKMGTNTMGGDDYTSKRKGGLRDFDGYDNVDYNKDMPMDEGMFSVIDQIRKDSKSVRDFIKNVLSDKDFRDMKSDKDFIKYLGSIYEGIVQESHYTAVANLGTKKSKENLDSFDELQKFMDKMKSRKAISVQVTKINGSKKQTINYEWDGRNWVSKNKKGVKENFPSNWMQGRTSDYHTKLRGKKRDYDDTNFDKENSGQTDLEETTKPDFNSKGYKEASKLVAKLRSSVFRKMSDNDLDQFRMVLAQAFDLKEYGSKLTEPFLLPKDEDKLDGTPPSKDAIDSDLEEEYKRDYKDEYKKFQSSKKSKKYRAELNKYNRQKGTYGNGDGKDASHKGGKIVGFESASKNRGRKEKSRLKKESVAINEIGVFPITNYMNGIVPSNFINTTTPKKKEKLKSTLRDLKNTLNRFWKQHNIPYRIK